MTAQHPKHHNFKPPTLFLRTTVLLLICSGLSNMGQAQQGTAPDFTLERALTRATLGLDWQNAELNYTASLRTLEGAQAATGLTANLGADYNLNGKTDGSSDPTQAVGLKADLSMALLPWSAGFDAVRSAQRALSKAAWDRRDQHNQVLINTQNQYFALRISQTDLEISQANLRLRQAQLEVSQKQLLTGQINAASYAASQIDLENAQNTLEQNQNTLEISRLTLANTLGIGTGIDASKPETELGPARTTPSETQLPTAPLEVLVAQAMLQRSDVQKAQIALEQAQDDHSSAQRDRFLPASSLNFSLSQQYSAVNSGSQGAGASQQGYQLGAGLNLQSGNFSLSGSTPIYSNNALTNATSSTTYTLSAKINLPLWNPASDAKISSSQLAVESAQAALERSQRSAELEVRNRYFDLVTACNRVKVSLLSQKQSQQNLETLQAKVKAGLSTPLELESARIQRLQADRDLENNQVSATLADLKLKSALGLELNAH
jgi:outer membrane protein